MVGEDDCLIISCEMKWKDSSRISKRSGAEEALRREVPAAVGDKRANTRKVRYGCDVAEGREDRLRATES